ncbi:MAG: SDR family oxidoreductase [Pseudolysinimonas sp.]|uniref:SDR family NAD(P)-dependent oxidoreductase n=1 Tax=Pseudolysinimonas sp. TaxID=2680009 RepID=UPI00326467D0
MTIDYRGTTALVTGASSGLGEQFARQLAARGANLVLVARRADRLEALASDLRAAHSVTVDVIPADLSKARPGRALGKELAKRGITVNTVIANAGFGSFAAFQDEDADRVADEVALNVAAVVDITREFYPAMLAAGTGALVTVASTAAFQPVPKMAIYGATKAFVLSFTEALWYESRHSGLRVLALCPGATETEFFDVAGNGERFGFNRDTAANVVKRAMKALDKRNGRGSLISGAGNAFGAVAVRMLPRGLATAMAGRLTGA